MGSGVYPFVGNAQTFLNDFAINNAYPGVEFGGTETNALYAEDREVSGTIYRVINATFNKVAQTWLPIDISKPCYALSLDDSGIVSVLEAAAGVSPFTWTVSSIINGSSFGINVKNYGATGNGVTDDTDAIQRAIAAAVAAGGDIVYFPPGTYLCGNGTNGGLQLASNCIYLGSGQGNTTLKLGPGGSGIVTMTPKAGQNTTPVSNVLVRDITFDVNGSTNVGVNMAATGMSNVWFENCTFQNSAGHQAVVFGYAPVWGAGNGGVTVSNYTTPAVGSSGSLTYTTGTGPYPPGYYQVVVGSQLCGSGSYVGLVTGVTQTNTTTYTITMTTVSLGSNTAGVSVINGASTYWASMLQSTKCGFRSCIFQNCSNTTYEALGFYQQDGATIEGCTFANNSTQSGHATAILCYGYGSNVRVANNHFENNSTGSITFGNHFNSEFVNNTIAPSTNTGEWQVILNNNSNLSILGNKFNGGGSNIAIALYDLTSTFDLHANLFEVSDELKISDNTFDNFGICVEALPNAVGRNQGFTNLSVTDNAFFNFVNYGVFISNGTISAGTNGINGVNVSRNRFPQQLTANIGVYIISQGTNPITRVKIDGNHWIGSALGTAVRLDDVVNARVNDNDMTAVATPINLQSGSSLFQAQRNLGYNPVGLFTSPPAFPATTVGYKNVSGADISAYVTAGTNDVSVVISGGSNGSVAAITVKASTAMQILLPNQCTFTPTYSAGSPTWVLQIN